MSSDLLQQIQALQFSDKPRAEALLREFVTHTFPLNVSKVELRPLAVSLNSFNGFLTLTNGERLFFKTHTESDEVIDEYYQAALLAEVGYPVIQPVFSSKESGKQFLIYEVIHDPSVFDVAWAIETGASNALDELTAAQNAADDLLYELYRKTLIQQSADQAARAAVHQLFFHRLTGGRLARFYGPLPGEVGESPLIDLPGVRLTMQVVRSARWQINGQDYTETLNDLISRAISLLNPAQAWPAVVGHGDAHNGNVFFHRQNGGRRMLYFDPAFAGSHHPLLDLTKPLFHNVFAMWMYFPHEKASQLQIDIHCGDVWQVNHNYTLHPVREMFLKSKTERVLLPILRDLKGLGWLQSDWREMLKAALFCCPLLTMNLTDSQKFSPEISLLGLVMAVEMGAESCERRSIIDTILDQVETQLQV